MRLTLLCHAATAATRAARFPEDEPLEPSACDRIARKPPHLSRADHCLTSPARRAVQTAERLGLAATVDPALRDADHGRWAGRTLEALTGEDPIGVQTWLGDPDAAPHGGEALTAVITRVGTWLGQREPGHTIAVTHPAIVRAAIVHVLGAPAATFWRIDVAPLSVAGFAGGPGRWTLRHLGASPDGD